MKKIQILLLTITLCNFIHPTYAATPDTPKTILTQKQDDADSAMKASTVLKHLTQTVEYMESSATIRTVIKIGVCCVVAQTPYWYLGSKDTATTTAENIALQVAYLARYYGGGKAIETIVSQLRPGEFYQQLSETEVVSRLGSYISENRFVSRLRSYSHVDVKDNKKTEEDKKEKIN